MTPKTKESKRFGLHMKLEKYKDILFDNSKFWWLIWHLYFQIAAERNKAAQQSSSNNEAIEAVKKEMESQMSTLRSENNDKVQDLENRLQVALSMFNYFWFLALCQTYFALLQ